MLCTAELSAGVRKWRSALPRRVTDLPSRKQWNDITLKHGEGDRWMTHLMGASPLPCNAVTPVVLLEIGDLVAAAACVLQCALRPSPVQLPLSRRYVAEGVAAVSRLVAGCVVLAASVPEEAEGADAGDAGDAGDARDARDATSLSREAVGACLLRLASTGSASVSVYVALSNVLSASLDVAASAGSDARLVAAAAAAADAAATACCTLLYLALASTSATTWGAAVVSQMEEVWSSADRAFATVADALTADRDGATMRGMLLLLPVGYAIQQQGREGLGRQGRAEQQGQGWRRGAEADAIVGRCASSVPFARMLLASLSQLEWVYLQDALTPVSVWLEAWVALGRALPAAVVTVRHLEVVLLQKHDMVFRNSACRLVDIAWATLSAPEQAAIGRLVRPLLLDALNLQQCSVTADELSSCSIAVCTLARTMDSRGFNDDDSLAAATWLHAGGVVASVERVLRQAALSSPPRRCHILATRSLAIAMRLAVLLVHATHPAATAAVTQLLSLAHTVRKVVDLDEDDDNMDSGEEGEAGRDRRKAERVADLWHVAAHGICVAWTECRGSRHLRQVLVRCGELSLSPLVRRMDVADAAFARTVHAMNVAGMAELTAVTGAPTLLLRTFLDQLSVQVGQAVEVLAGILAHASDDSRGWRVARRRAAAAERITALRIADARARVTAASDEVMATCGGRERLLTVLVCASTVSDDDIDTASPSRVIVGCHYARCPSLTGVSEQALTCRLCSGCRHARYCSVDCQKRAWRRVHRRECGVGA